MDDEKKFVEKLKRIEALYDGATTDGERVAAENALNRIKEKLKENQQLDPPVEYKFTLSNTWSRRLFVALLRRYGINPYRYYRQRYTTVMAKASKTFVDKVLWPEFKELDIALQEHLNEITTRIISKAIHSNISEAEEIRAIDNGSS